MTMNNDWVALGRVKAHGLKGALKLTLFANDLDLAALSQQLITHKTLRLKNSANDLLLLTNIISLKNLQQHWLCKVADLDTLEEAQKFNGAYLEIPRSTLPPLDVKEFYLFELVGTTAYLHDEEIYLGQICNLFDNGGQILLQIIDEAQPAKEPELLVPLTPETIKRFDRLKKIVWLQLPHGLRE